MISGTAALALRPFVVGRCIHSPFPIRVRLPVEAVAVAVWGVSWPPYSPAAPDDSGEGVCPWLSFLSSSRGEDAVPSLLGMFRYCCVPWGGVALGL